MLGGTNDAFASKAEDLGSLTDLDANPVLFYRAVATLINKIQGAYPHSALYFILNDDTESHQDIKIRDAIKQVCSLRGIGVIEPVGITKIGSHPDVAGMERIARAVPKYVVDADTSANTLQIGDPSCYWINLASPEWESTGRAQFLLSATVDTDGTPDTDIYRILGLHIPEGTVHYAITESGWADTLVKADAPSPGTWDITYTPGTGDVTFTPPLTLR